MTPGEERDAKLRSVAVEVALKTGLLKRCAAHGGVYDPGQHDYQGACMVATYLVNQAGWETRGMRRKHRCGARQNSYRLSWVP